MQIGSVDVRYSQIRAIVLLKRCDHDFTARQIPWTQAVVRAPRDLSLMRAVGIHLPDLPIAAASFLPGKKNSGGVEVNLRISSGEELRGKVLGSGTIRLRMEAYDAATFGKPLGAATVRKGSCLHEDNVRPNRPSGIRCRGGGGWLCIRRKSDGANGQENCRRNSNVNKEIWLARSHSCRPGSA